MEITPEQYSELCDLFEQAWHHTPLNEEPDRPRFTSDEARRFSGAAMRVLGFEHPDVPEDPELLKRMASYLNKHDPT